MNEVWDVSLNDSLSDFVHNHMKVFDGFYPQFQWDGVPLPMDFRMWAWSDILERAITARTLVRDRDVQSFKQREKAILLCRRHVLGAAYDKALNRYYAEMTRRINKRMWGFTDALQDSMYIHDRLHYMCMYLIKTTSALYTDDYQVVQVLEDHESHVVHTGGSTPFGDGPLFEWAVHRLRYLVDVVNICGSRAYQLLYDGLCPIEVPPEARILHGIVVPDDLKRS